MKKLTLLFLILVIAGCASSRQDWIKLTDFHEKIQLKGFSVYPPQAGYNWYILQKTDGEIIFKGQNYRIYSTLVIEAWLMKLSPDLITDEDYRSFLKRSRELNPDPARFEIILHDESVDYSRKTLCVNYHLVSLDKQAHTFEGLKIQVLDIYGLTCRHPDDKEYAIHVRYSERYDKNKPPHDLKERAQSFFATFTLEKL